MDKELIEQLIGLGALGLTALTLVILAYALLFRTKSGTKQADSNMMTIGKLFGLLEALPESYQAIGAGINQHSIESTTRHIEVLGGFQQLNIQFMNMASAMLAIKQGFDKDIEHHEQIINKVNDLSANVGAYTEKVKEVGGTIMNRVTSLDDIAAAMTAMRRDMQQLTTTVDEATATLKATVATKVAEYDTRFGDIESAVKALQPTTKAIDPTIPKSKPETEGDKPPKEKTK